MIENECALLNDEKRRIEDDSRVRSDSDLNTIGRYRQDNDDLRRLTHDRDTEVAQV